MKPLKMQDHMDKGQVPHLFERFMSLTQGLGSGQYTDRKIRDELRELGELGPAIVGEEAKIVPSDDDDCSIEEVVEDLDDANPYESSATDTRPTEEARESAQRTLLVGNSGE